MRFTFGKYKNYFIKDVIAFDAQYVMWCYKKFEWFKKIVDEKNLKFALVKEYNSDVNFSHNQQVAWAYGFGKNAKQFKENRIDRKIELKLIALENSIKISRME